MRILIDNGHGAETKGKQSPDGRLKEWAYSREIAHRVVAELTRHGVMCSLLVGEDRDVRLSERVGRANAICRASGGRERCLLVSIHVNGAGSDGLWHTARGWQVCVSRNASKASKQLAFNLTSAAERLGLKVRRPMATQPYWVQNLSICRDVVCPAILTENLFQDNKEDVDFLLSEEGREAIVRVHVDGILAYLAR